MLKGMHGPVGKIVAAVGLFHADVIGHNVSVYAGDIHSLGQCIMIHRKTGDLFHTILHKIQNT